ncbi:DUF397 domain-containing protein [Plantactinospora sp. KLBMP9567]|uniref:DUF397 domain-containing protein n=1 Tax=Plantactinospora sp. KLBMP9567 TaxID=3085900 RepID=UPI0029821155|nr:DUF397 domain-containing protein [Plantactinospora sp. KLBMP9567]MDW5330555.1 DUF397 domain-containing protein [Plantactinospora sp. KLBMP9567]
MGRNAWRKSSRSGSNGQCVEVRDRGAQVDLRDSKAPTAGMLTFDAAAWTALASILKAAGTLR